MVTIDQWPEIRLEHLVVDRLPEADVTIGKQFPARTLNRPGSWLKPILPASIRR